MIGQRGLPLVCFEEIRLLLKLIKGFSTKNLENPLNDSVFYPEATLAKNIYEIASMKKSLFFSNNTGAVLWTQTVKKLKKELAEKAKIIISSLKKRLEIMTFRIGSQPFYVYE